MESRIDKINRLGQQMRTDAQNEQDRQMCDRFEWSLRIKALAPRIKELIETGDTLVKNHIDLGPVETRCVIKVPKFLTDGISHKFGFKTKDPYYVEMGRRGSGEWLHPTSIGFAEIGWCDSSFLVDDEGVIIEGTNMKYNEFIKLCHDFLGSFEKFEKEFYEWVDTITA